MSNQESEFLEIVDLKKGFGSGETRQEMCIRDRCGLVDKIRMLADEKLQITLAISLHAPNDEIRRQTIDVYKRQGRVRIPHSGEKH